MPGGLQNLLMIVHLTKALSLDSRLLRSTILLQTVLFFGVCTGRRSPATGVGFLQALAWVFPGTPQDEGSHRSPRSGLGAPLCKCWGQLSRHTFLPR